jgi:hypothetical protein
MRATLALLAAAAAALPPPKMRYPLTPADIMNGVVSASSVPSSPIAVQPSEPGCPTAADVMGTNASDRWAVWDSFPERSRCRLDASECGTNAPCTVVPSPGRVTSSVAPRTRTVRLSEDAPPPLVLVGLSVSVSEVVAPVWQAVREYCDAGVVSNVDLVVRDVDVDARSLDLTACTVTIRRQSNAATAMPRRLERLAMARAEQQSRVLATVDRATHTAVAVLDFDALVLPAPDALRAAAALAHNNTMCAPLPPRRPAAAALFAFPPPSPTAPPPPSGTRSAPTATSGSRTATLPGG